MSWLELASEQWWSRGPTDLGIDHGGRPAVPVVLLTDGAATCAGRAVPDEAGPIVIVVAESSAEIAPCIADAADVLMVRRAADRRAVEVSDPLVEARALASKVCTNPVAALSLAWLLRAEHYREVRRGLVAESATYSMLLASEEFHRWREEHPARERRNADGPRIHVWRDGDVLRVTLTNPDRHNAMDARMRDELGEALALARWDTSLSVVMDADGPSFGSGGDLDEFATAPDPARAHVTRLAASLGLILTELAGRVEVRVHGDCFGAGIEVPAFAHRLVSRPDATFTLPEVSMGLVPGAGGTTSTPRRIGRRRALWWALSGRPLEADLARDWGLVDALE